MLMEYEGKDQARWGGRRRGRGRESGVLGERTSSSLPEGATGIGGEPKDLELLEMGGTDGVEGKGEGTSGDKSLTSLADGF
jgi:hypothetical protein